MRGHEVYNKFTGRKISAVLPVHVFGLPAKINEIKEVCSKWKLPLVEDAAEALGSKFKKKIRIYIVGGLGIWYFKLQRNKIITAGGGGAILTNDKKMADLAKHLSTTAKVAHPDFIHDCVGWNDRLQILMLL